MHPRDMSKEQYLQWLGEPECDHEKHGRGEPKQFLFDVRDGDGELVVFVTPQNYYRLEGCLYDGSIHVFELCKAGFMEEMESVFSSPFNTAEETVKFLTEAGFQPSDDFSSFLDDTD